MSSEVISGVQDLNLFDHKNRGVGRSSVGRECVPLTRHDADFGYSDILRGTGSSSVEREGVPLTCHDADFDCSDFLQGTGSSVGIEDNVDDDGFDDFIKGLETPLTEIGSSPVANPDMDFSDFLKGLERAGWTSEDMERISGENPTHFVDMFQRLKAIWSHSEEISGVPNQNLSGLRNTEVVQMVPQDDLVKILDMCFPSPLRNLDHHYVATVASDDEDDVAPDDDDDVASDDYDDVSSYSPPFPFPSLEGSFDFHDHNVNYYGLDRVSGPVYHSKAGIVGKKISQGDRFDVISLLSWTPRGRPRRTFLSTPDGSKVDIKTLKGKYVVVCCVFLPLHNRFHGYKVEILRAVCAAAAAPNCPFKLVIVPKLRPGFDSRLVIDHSFSGFPSTCLAIPYNCSISCDHACISLGLSGNRPLTTLIVDPNGIVLQKSCQCFLNYGSDAYPFTDEHLRSLVFNTDLLQCRVDEIYFKTKGFYFVKEEQLTPNHAPTLDELLFCDRSNPLPLATDENVCKPVSELNVSYVGLYLCQKGFLMRTLSQLRNLEILIIPLPFNESPSTFVDSIRRSLGKYNISSWWLFPYDDRVCRRLWQLTNSSMSDELIILPPAGSGLSGELSGKTVIGHFGLDAYPFTKSYILERYLERLSKITLKHLFPKGCTSVCEEHLVNASFFEGKDVFIYLEPDDSPDYTQFSCLFKIGRAHPHAVLVYVPPKSYKHFIENHPPGMLVSRSCATDVISILFDKAENVNHGTIIAVKNGCILSRCAQKHLNKYGAFPNHDYLRWEIVTDLSKLDYLYGMLLS